MGAGKITFPGAGNRLPSILSDRDLNPQNHGTVRPKGTFL